jgi:hypothetical protein
MKMGEEWPRNAQRQQPKQLGVACGSLVGVSVEGQDCSADGVCKNGGDGHDVEC